MTSLIARVPARPGNSADVPIASASSSAAVRLPILRSGPSRDTLNSTTARRLHGRSLLCSSTGPGGSGGGDDPLANLPDSLRRWMGLDTSPPSAPGATNSRGSVPPGAEMNINPGQSVMDIEDYFSNLTVKEAVPGSGQPPAAPPPPSPLGDWSTGVEDDWDDWTGNPAVADLDDSIEVAELREQVIERRRARAGRRTVVRDEYLRPIVDATGIYNRLAIGEREAEERVFVEAITNQYESREALRYAGVLIGVPLVVGFAVSHLVAQPLWGYAQSIDPDAFALTDEQKVAGAEAMHREEVRLRLEASVGQAPTLTDEAMLNHLRDEAKVWADSMRAYNKQALLNVVSDSTSALSLFLLLLRDNSQRAILFRTIGRVFAGLSDTAKAFLIILVTDTLLGYHSEEGWTAGLTLLSHHYGWHAHKEGLQLFVATVPVLLDSMFKYWIFVGLNKIDPAAAVTLRQMDRH